MSQSFIERLRQNLQTKNSETISVLFALFGAILLVWLLIDWIFWIGIFGLVIAAPLVIWIATRLPNLAWFWGREEGTQQSVAADAATNDQTTSDEELETDEIWLDDPDDLDPEPAESFGFPENIRFEMANNVLPGCAYVRKLPQGTRLLSQTPEQAVIQIKSVIRFWCWALPTAFFVGAVFSAPIGAAMGFMVYAESRNNYRLDPTEYLMWGAIIPGALFLLMAWISYISTRPWVTVTVKSDTIRYGDETFDRRFSKGIRIGYTTQEADLRSSFLAPSLGVQSLRLTYGRWGEDLKYMVNAYHASEIVIWMNEIIASVGAPPPKRHDPYAGQKIELL